MALIKCPECGNTVSDTANMCPHCGFILNMESKIEVSNKKAKKRNKKNLFGILQIIIGIISLLLAGAVLVGTIIWGDEGTVLSFSTIRVFICYGFIFIAGVLIFVFRKTNNANHLLCVSFLYFVAVLVIRIGNGTRGLVFEDAFSIIAGMINMIVAIKLMGDNKRKKMISIVAALILLLSSAVVSWLAVRASEFTLNLTDGTTCKVKSGSQVLELYNQTEDDGAPYFGAAFEMDTTIISISEEIDESGAVYVITTNGFMFYDNTHDEAYWKDLSQKNQKIHIKGHIGEQRLIVTDYCVIVVESIEEK